MEKDKTLEMMEETLQAPLDSDSPENLYKQLTLIESLAYLACKRQAQAENRLSTATAALAHKKSECLPNLTGTQMEKSVSLESLSSDEQQLVDKWKAEVAYWKQVGRLIENKISLGQSILGNITSQIKAGMYVNMVK